MLLFLMFCLAGGRWAQPDATPRARLLEFAQVLASALETIGGAEKEVSYLRITSADRDDLTKLFRPLVGPTPDDETVDSKRSIEQLTASLIYRWLPKGWKGADVP